MDKFFFEYPGKVFLSIEKVLEKIYKQGLTLVALP